MAVPDYQTVMRPLLEAAASGAELRLRDIGPAVAAKFGLSEAERTELLPSGRQAVFANRLHWAKTYLARAGALQATQRGSFRITDRGRSLLSDPQPINVKALDRFPEFAAWRRASSSTTATDGSIDAEAITIDQNEPAVLSPEDRIEQSAVEIQSSLKADLLARIHAEPPLFFERFIRDLMLAMGYGGGIRDRGFLTGRTGDGGIDGLIHEDSLGLDAVYLQAKRYQPGSNVPAGEIRGFVGAMTGENATKGVFVTTSAFTRDATAFVERVTQRIVLIDGERLAELALRHGVGVRTQRTIAIQRIDEDYFTSED